MCEDSSDSVSTVMDEDAREVYLFGSITMETASQVILFVRQLDRAAKSNISLIVGSDGGEEGAGWAIYDALCLTRSKIVAQCYAECMSISALILQACDTRLLAPNCRFMIHNGSVSFNTAPLEKVRSALKEENFLTQMYYEKLAEKSNLTVDQVKELCNNESYMNAEVAVGYGFADGILGETKKRGKNVRKK